MASKQTTAITTSNAAAEALDIAVQRGIEAQAMAGRMVKALAVAQAMADIRAAFTPSIMEPIMALQNTTIGFMTDHNPANIDKKTGKPYIPYPAEIVRDCAIDALLQGVLLTGNQMNIISGRCYITKEGMGKKLKDIDGLSYSVTTGIAQMASGGAIQPVDVEWEYNGVKGKRTLQICVRLNDGMGVDACAGKATRKARAWLYQHITGQEIPDGELDADGVKVVRGKVVEDKPSRFDKAADDLLAGVK